jgi:hypothetical protein
MISPSFTTISPKPGLSYTFPHPFRNLDRKNPEFLLRAKLIFETKKASPRLGEAFIRFGSVWLVSALAKLVG